MQAGEVSTSWHEGFRERHSDKVTFGKKHAIDPLRKQWCTKWVREEFSEELGKEFRDAGVVNRNKTLKADRIGYGDETPMSYEGGKHMDHKGYVTIRVRIACVMLSMA